MSGIRRIVFFLFLSVLCSLRIFAQLPVDKFRFTQPNYKVYNSLYNSLSFVDARKEGPVIGKVFNGLLRNSESNLVLPDNVNLVFQNMVTALVDSTAKDGKLLFQLRRFRFCETSNTRYCYLTAVLYVEQNHNYSTLAYLDTVLIFTSQSFENALMFRSSTIISDFLSRNLLQQPRLKENYSLDEVKAMDSIEKARLPLYADSVYHDGIYSNYNAFKNQKPDVKAVVSQRKDGSVSSIKVQNADGEFKKIKPGTIYAVVAGGQPFVATDFGYYPLTKLSTDFYFTGEVKVASASSEKAANSAGEGGIAGVSVSALSNGFTYYLTIDHLNGRLVHLQPISNSSQP